MESSRMGVMDPLEIQVSQESLAGQVGPDTRGLLESVTLQPVKVPQFLEKPPTPRTIKQYYPSP